ncbi:MAG: PUR family DNA/RNA-binding protein [Prevotellaceae bacterium]|jgi:hypothetical protein|nr:PUR family DNA/RNA-binding protein [Prevotellaceae bacterium]
MDDFEEHDGERQEELFSKPVKAGKRTYFFDVKATREGDLYLILSESKRLMNRQGKFSYEKHKIFLFQEDFEKFLAGLNEALDYIAGNASTRQFGAGQKERPSFSDVSFEELRER